jgi:hypothetical protein
MKNILIKLSKLPKEKYKIYGSKNKGATRRRTELDPLFKEIIRLREW